MQRIATWIMALALLVGASAAFAQAGKGYEVLPTPQPTESKDGVEVREFFSYACPHCANFRPLMHDWLEKSAPKEVRLVRTAVVFRDDWRPLAKAYYAAEVLGVLDKIHAPLFEAIHQKNQRFRNDGDLVDFFAAHGVPRDKAQGAFDSFAVDMKLRQGAQQLRGYRIESTPTVVVAGKYVVSPRTAGGHEGMIQTIDRLVRQELAAKK